MFFTALLHAQTGSLAGRVTDESGAVVSGALINANSAKTTSRPDGTYSFTSLPSGKYTVAAVAPDLALTKPIAVAIGTTPVVLDLRLIVVGKAQQVTVAADGTPTVSLESSNNAGAIVITGKDLDALADDPEDLAADLQALAGPAAGPNGGSIFIDGFSGGQLPPKESIREIRINQNPFSPEFDRLGYGRIEIFTKPGADKFKGSLGYNFQHSAINSRNPYASGKAPLLLNEFENSIGGPLGKKTSFTLDVQRHMVDNGYIANGYTLDSAFNIVPFNATQVSEQRRILATPRVDYQLNQANTLTLRYSFTDTQLPNAGIGGFDFVSRGYKSSIFANTIQASDTLIHGNIVYETRLQFFRFSRTQTPNSNSPLIQVLGAFSDGGATTGLSSDLQNSYELQNNASVLHGTHMFRFGVRLRESNDDNFSRANFNGTYTFRSIDAYRQTLLKVSGAGPAQFSITAGAPELKVNQFDAAIFGGDDWRARPNLTVSYGMRYEAQTNLGDHLNIAPRLGLAWAPGGASQKHKTVLRAGFGMFYDRFAQANTLSAQRFNGLVQQQYVLTAPTFFPAIPTIDTLLNAKSPQVKRVIDANLSAPYTVQGAWTLERQLTGSTTVSATYALSHVVHEMRSLDINAPLNGVYPYGSASPIFLTTSTGIYNQQQLIVNVSAKPLPQVSLFGYYAINQAKSNTDGLGTFPANPYNWSGEYGPSALDIRHRMLIGGSIAARWGIRLSPLMTIGSGTPFDITTGQDQFGTTVFNSRPGIAQPGRVGAIQTAYGLLDPNPLPGETILGRNAGRGPGQVTVNLRINKAFGFGPEKGGPKQSGPARVDAGAISNPGGLRNILGSVSSSRKYSLVLGMSVRNVINHNNPGAIIGNIGSPLFGQANSIAGGVNGEGFSENANNRRAELQVKLNW